MATGGGGEESSSSSRPKGMGLHFIYLSLIFMVLVSDVSTWAAFLLAAKFKEIEDKDTFDKVANKKASPSQLAAQPQIKWEEWLDEAKISGSDDRVAIITGLQDLKKGWFALNILHNHATSHLHYPHSYPCINPL